MGFGLRKVICRRTYCLFLALFLAICIVRYYFITDITVDTGSSSKINYPKLPPFDYGDNTCPPRQNMADYVELLRSWVHLAKKINMSYFLTSGSLLSVVRDGELVPMEVDMDVMIEHKDVDLLMPYRTKRPVQLFKDKTTRLVLQEDWRQPGSRRRILKCDNTPSPSYNGLCGFRYILGRLIKDRSYIDIYQYDLILKDNKTCVEDMWNKYDYSSIFPLRQCELINVTTVCPSRPFDVLHKFYGKNLEPDFKCINKTWVKVKR